MRTGRFSFSFSLAFALVLLGCDNKSGDTVPPNPTSAKRPNFVPKAEPDSDPPPQPRMTREEVDRLVEAAGKNVVLQTVDIKAGNVRGEPLVWTMKVPKGANVTPHAILDTSTVTSGARFALKIEPRESELEANRSGDLYFYEREDPGTFGFITIVPVGHLDCRVRTDHLKEDLTFQECLLMLKCARTLAPKVPPPADPVAALTELGAKIEMRDGRTVGIAMTSVNNRTTALLKSLPDLETARLSRCGMLDSGLDNLTGLKKLRVLQLDANTFTDEGLSRLAGLTNLEELILTDWIGVRNFDGSGLRHLAGLKKLRRLQILLGDGTGRTPPADAHLLALSGLTSLKVLHIGYNIDGSGLKHLRDLPLEELRLRGSARGAANMQPLAGGFKNLKILRLEGKFLSGVCLLQLKALPALESLTLKEDVIEKLLNDASLTHLAGIAGLKKLELIDAKVTPAMLSALSKVPTLEMLVFDSSDLDDAGLKSLAEVKSLKVLDTGYAKVSDAAKAELVKALPGLKMH